MSCQQASRAQEDPYAFTEPAPLQANTSLYKHPHSNTVASGSGNSTASPVIQAGTSLLASNSGLTNAAQQRIPTGSPKVAPIKVTLVPSSTAFAKSRLNGATITTSAGGTAVFRTVSVPQATTILQRPAGVTAVAAAAAAPVTSMVLSHTAVTATTTTATLTTSTTSSPTTVFTKPLQVQISPQQASKFSRRVLASKSPNVSPAAAIQTLRIVKNPSPQQPPGGRPTVTPDARRYLNHSSNSVLGPSPPTTTTVSPPVGLQSVSPTKIRLIQPQPQGKIFLHTPNSSNSLAAATHISNPASIAALRNTLAKQNPSLLSKIPHAGTIPMQVSPASTTTSTTAAAASTVLPVAKVMPPSTTTTINIRRSSPPTSQMSLESPTSATSSTSATASAPLIATVKSAAAASAVTPPKSVVNSQQPAMTSPVFNQRSKTPTTSILKPQSLPPQAPPLPPPPPQPPSQPAMHLQQDDIGFTIPSFIIPKQQEMKPEPTDFSPPSEPNSVPVFTSPATPSSSTTPSAVSSTPKAHPKGRQSQSDRAGGSTSKASSSQATGKRAKRSYSRSSHHETLERISSTADEDEQREGKVADIKPVRFPKWKPPGAIAVPLNREWHAPDSYVFDVSAPGSVSYDSLDQVPLVQEFWFEETFASTGLEGGEAALSAAGGLPPGRKGRKSSGEEQNRLLLQNLDEGGELKKLSRNERLELKKAYLRRKAVQYWNGQRLRSSAQANKRLKAVEKTLVKLNQQRETMLKKNGGLEQPKCQRPGCTQTALLATTHCYQHITDNTEQRLFQQCTAKFSDNSQCRVPVFDISHELILCREHAWKHDNHDKMSAEVKLLKKPAGGAAAKKKALKAQPAIRVPPPASSTANAKKNKKKKKLTPFQQQMALHQQQYKQQYSSIGHSKTSLPPPSSSYVSTASGSSTMQQLHHNTASKSLQQAGQFRQGAATMSQQQQQQLSQIKYPQHTVGVPVQTVSSQTASNRNNQNVHIPLNQQRQQLLQNSTAATHSLYQQVAQIGHPQQTNLHQQPHQLLQHHPSQQHPMIGRNEDLILTYAGQQPQQPHHQQHHQQHPQFSQQQVQQLLSTATTQDLLNICENSSAYASSEDTGVGGLSESELMAAQDVIEEIPFEIGNLNNVLSQLPPDAFNELLFSEQEQNGPPFESTKEEEEDLERALEVVGEHVKSLEDMTVESANFLGDFLDNVDDEMLDGSDICSDQMLQSPNTNDIRGLVHT